MIKIIIYFTLFSSFTLAYAQEESKIPSGGAHYSVHLGPGRELQINVQIWGRVMKPGMYSVPKTTDLIALMSFAGGPAEDANLGKIKIVRSNPEPEVIKLNLKKYMRTGKLDLIPVLKPGDTVIIPGNVFHTFSRLTSVIAQLAIVANVYYLFFMREK
ncbi:SLBB domain-containing protein [candidate division WOR-3 bacterium]|nr:SLBB domain-containing protein [candidate division WOR-3 bacterium]